MHPWFCFPVWYSFEFRNDMTGWFGYFISTFFFFFPLILIPNVFNCDEFERLWFECVCFVLLLSHQFSHCSELTWCCILLQTTLFFPPNDIFSHFNSTSPCRMHLLYTLTKHIFSECICCYLFTFVTFVCYWNVTTVGESMLENVIR